jgi:hypothetical protein
MRGFLGLLTVLLASALAGVCPALASADDISITPTTLPDASAGTSYYEQLTAHPPAADTSDLNFGWQVSSGSMPDGMYLSATGPLDEDGIVQGKPSVPEQVQFTITVTHAGYSGSQSYTLNVGPPQPTADGLEGWVQGLPWYVMRNSGCVGLLINETLSGRPKHC